MHSKRQSGHRPKISTMPRQRSEATHYLDIYRLTIERKRLQQELNGLERRCQQINQRLTTIDTQVNLLETDVQHLRTAKSNQREVPTPTSNIYLSNKALSATESRDQNADGHATDLGSANEIDMMTLDY